MADEPLLARLHSGREDAERDVTEGLLLRGGFLPNPAYRAALGGRKMLFTLPPDEAQRPVNRFINRHTAELQEDRIA